MRKKGTIRQQHHPTSLRQIQSRHDLISLAPPHQPRNRQPTVPALRFESVHFCIALMNLNQRLFPMLAAISLATSCRPADPLTPYPTLSGSDREPSPETRPQTQPTPATPKPLPLAAPRITRKTISGIEFEGVSFDSRSHILRVIDQKNGPGSTFATSRDVAARTDALLAINGGFFTPEGEPLGLVISGGNRSGGWNSASSLGSGIYRIAPSGVASISRRKSRSAVSDSIELLQAGPVLVENGAMVSGLDSEKTAVRSIVLTDGASRWWIGRTSSCSLSSLGRALSTASPAGWNIKQALNLDGGRSTDLFISSRLSGGPLERRGFLNRSVRNFLVLKPL